VRERLGVAALACAAALVVPWEQSTAAANNGWQYIDDAGAGPQVGQFSYDGKWEHVRGRKDGRSFGTSARSHHASDSATLPFRGTQVRLYGVLGKKGGFGTLLLDGALVPDTVSFYAPTVRTNALIYTSPQLSAGVHTLVIQVGGVMEKNSRGDYVNIDGAEVFSR
jgi:hypothetical protein